jgi:hypothetical protein
MEARDSGNSITATRHLTASKTPAETKIKPDDDNDKINAIVKINILTDDEMLNPYPNK